MKSDKFNRKLRRFLAASLGASCVSTMMVTAMENPIQNRNIQEDLLNFNQQTRQNLWAKVPENAADIQFESDNITYSFNVAHSITDSNSYSFCWLLCNHKPEIKFIMLNLNGGTLLIIPCKHAEDVLQIAEEVSKYFEENPTQGIADFEQNCWANKDNIKSYIASLNQENNDLEQEQEDSVIKRSANWFMRLPDSAKVSLLVPTIPILGTAFIYILKKIF